MICIGDIYEGQFADNMMNGIGTYTYKSSQDIYSGSWLNNKKHGEGRYEYFADKSMMVGTWEQNDMVSGAWELKDSAVYTGKFRMGVPVGPGKFVFKSGLTLPGVFEETNVVAETTEEPVAEEEEGNEGEAKETVPPEPPIVVWRGESIVSF